MRLLYLATWFPYPPDNGYKLRAYYLLRALCQAHEVTLVSFAFDTARPDEAGDLRCICTDIQSVTVNPFTINRAGALRTFLSPRPVASRPIPAMRQLVADLLQTNRFDAVIASTEMMADYALLAPTDSTRILEEHNAMVRWARERYESASGPVQRIRYWASWQKSRVHDARRFRQFDLVTMVSEVDRQTTLGLIGAHGPAVEVVPNGVDCQHNHPGLADPRPGALVYSGSLTYSANFDAMQWFLAEIYPQIRAQTPNAALTVTGSTAGVDTAALALDNSVTLTGNVPDVRIPVAEATACVVPLRQGSGTRLKILEAMALGTPVIATRKGAEGLNVVDGEHLLLADDPATFAHRTSELLRDASLRARLVCNARQLVEEHYDWTQLGHQFVNLVEASVARRAAP